MDKLISIIIPVYRVEPFIRKCLNSVINQTYRNLEIILVDDGSPDNCGAICDEYATNDPRIKVIHQNNGGLCKARNAGLGVVTGDYIGFVDPDDWISSDMYEYLIKNAELHNADIACCRYYRVIPNKDIISICDGMKVTLSKDEAIRELISGNILRTYFCNKLFRKELFDDIRFPENRTYEGTAILHRVFEKADKVVSLGDPKYYYVVNNQSITKSRTLKNGMDYVVAHINRYHELVPKYPDLRKKLMTKTIKAIRELSDIGYMSKQDEIDKASNDLVLMKEFINGNVQYFESIGISRAQRKELRYLSRITLKGFKKAHKYRAITRRLSKIKNSIINYKKGNGTPIVARKLDEQSSKKLRELQLCEIEIFDEFVKICNKHNLKYYLYGGTLLGAVRHKGFIPWDDDMDIVMPRADYDRFLKVCAEDLPAEYFLQTCFTDKGYPKLSAKIRKNGTYVCEEKWRGKDIHQGIFIDILPLDRFPKNRFWGTIILHFASILHQVISFNRCHSKKISGYLIYKLLSLFPVSFIFHLREGLLHISNSLSSDKYYCSFGSHYRPMRKRVLNKEWFSEGTPLEFEGKTYNAPSQWENYLIHLYGSDYMELPPKEKRICHLNLYECIFSAQDKETKGERLQ